MAANPGEQFHVPTWVVVSAASAMAFGTYVGGWRIIRTRGQRVVHLQPHRGFAAETATATLLYATAQFGFPVSTTHTISGGVLGAGATTRLSAVRWGIAGNILAAWLFTLPIAACVGAALELAARRSSNLAVVPLLLFAAALVLVAIGAAAFLRVTRKAKNDRLHHHVIGGRP